MLQNLPVEYIYPGTTMIVFLTTLPIDNHKKKKKKKNQEKFFLSATERKP